MPRQEQDSECTPRFKAKFQNTSEDLKHLTTGDFAHQAKGFAMLAWESWIDLNEISSDHPLIAVLPGNRSEQIQAQTGVSSARIVTCEVALCQPLEEESRREQRFFAKVVTMVNHTKNMAEPTFMVEHEGQNIEMAPAYKCKVYADYWADLAPHHLEWSHKAVRQAMANALEAMKVKGGYQTQWPTFRLDSSGSKATVLIAADEKAREQLLRLSGVDTLIFTREHQEGKATPPPEYCPVWVKMSPSETKNTLGIARAAAAATQHWGICRSARNNGVRAPKESIGTLRETLRPADTTLNEQNKTLMAHQQWVVKNVEACATAEELGKALAPHWAVIPIRPLSVRKGKGIWLVQASEKPSR